MTSNKHKTTFRRDGELRAASVCSLPWLRVSTVFGKPLEMTSGRVTDAASRLCVTFSSMCYMAFRGDAGRVVKARMN